MVSNWMEVNMLNFSSFLDLPLIWGGIIATAIFLYVLLDGFDLGLGILFPFAPTERCRNVMVNSIAPFWDANETWLVLGGGGLFAAFPLAYSIVMPALYMPIILMLLGLVFRGVAFEFRFKSQGFHRKMWGYAFHFGSMVAAFFQGVMLGAFVEGIKVNGREYAGNSLDWLSAFSIMTGIALIFGYALLGSTWLIMKTDLHTQVWARKIAMYVLLFVLLFIGLVSLWVPYLHVDISNRWFSYPNIIILAPIPLLTLFCAFKLIVALFWKLSDAKPFIYSILLFLLCYIGLAISLWPWIVPYQVTLRTAAADPSSQTFLLIGVTLFLPFVLGYTLYSYFVFRGKSKEHEHY